MRCPRWMIALMVSLGCASAQAADRIYFRDGSSQAGRVVSQSNGVYTFASARGGTIPIDRKTVRFVVYGDEATATERLGLDAFREMCTDPTSAEVDFLPAEDYGAAALEAIRGAKRYIYVMTYNLSGSQSGVIADIYEALQERAQDGVKVYIIAPGGSRAAAGVRISSMNYAETLAASGVQVRFLTQSKVQHKKLLIVDLKKAFVGSSNLTSAAVTDNIEWNMVTEQPAFVQEAIDDFRSMRRRAKSPDEVKF